MRLLHRLQDSQPLWRITRHNQHNRTGINRLPSIRIAHILLHPLLHTKGTSRLQPVRISFLLPSLALNKNFFHRLRTNRIRSQLSSSRCSSTAYASFSTQSWTSACLPQSTVTSCLSSESADSSEPHHLPEPTAGSLCNAQFCLSITRGSDCCLSSTTDDATAYDGTKCSALSTGKIRVDIKFVMYIYRVGRCSQVWRCYEEKLLFKNLSILGYINIGLLGTRFEIIFIYTESFKKVYMWVYCILWCILIFNMKKCELQLWFLYLLSLKIHCPSIWAGVLPPLKS